MKAKYLISGGGGKMERHTLILFKATGNFTLASIKIVKNAPSNSSH